MLKNMEITRKSCRLCLAESEFNACLFGTFCRRINMVEKIFVCLKIMIEENDLLNTICYKCAESIERYYNFIMVVKKSQSRFSEPRNEMNNSPLKRHHITSYVREQVYDADYTFSFLEVQNEDKKENNTSSPFFSYFSPPNALMKKSPGEHLWKTPRPLCENLEKKDDGRIKRHCKTEMPRHHSRDLFDSQSQEVDEESRAFNWKLTPDDNIINRIRGKCFKQSDF